MLENTHRAPTCIFVSGTTDTGKSYLAKLLAAKIEGRKLVVSYTGGQATWKEVKIIRPSDDNPKALKFKKGWRHLPYTTPDLSYPLQSIYDNYTKGLLILDDLRNYVRSNWENTRGLVPCIVDHRHKGYDIIMIAHSLKQLPPSLWPFIKHAFIFKSNVIPKNTDLEIEQAQQVIDLQKKVNQRYADADKTGKFTKGIFEYIKL